MIPTIGTMIGAYIIAKLLWIIGIKGDSEASVLTKIFCVIGIIVSVFGIYSLMTTGSSIPNLGY